MWRASVGINWRQLPLELVTFRMCLLACCASFQCPHRWMATTHAVWIIPSCAPCPDVPWIWLESPFSIPTEDIHFLWSTHAFSCKMAADQGEDHRPDCCHKMHHSPFILSSSAISGIEVLFQPLPHDMLSDTLKLFCVIKISSTSDAIAAKDTNHLPIAIA